jgi:glucose-1-phosphate thymidylyltransferase
MKGVVLAGGTGSRLYPLTKVTNKHLLPVGRQPMIYYPIQKLREAGIEEILVVTGREHMGDVVALLGSGAEFDCSFTYKVQDEAGGIAQALGLAENFASGQSIAVILGDNVFADPITPMLDCFAAKGDAGAVLGLKKVDDPERFGVAEVRDGKVIGVEEKPAHPKSSLAVIGVYLFDAGVYDIIRGLKPSARDELEITDVSNAYIRAEALSYHEFKNWWTDAGTFDSLARASGLVEGLST